MRYDINAGLIYDAADGTLTLSGSDTPDTQLSITASALLYFFLQHQEVVSRDDVLKKVWDDNGLTSSNSNLNQYLSMLRKTFRHYGVDNIILTISRGNLQFNPDISCECLDTHSSGHRPTGEEKAYVDLPASPAALTQGPSVRHRKPVETRWYIASAALLIASLLLITLIVTGPDNVSPLSPAPVTGNACEVMGTADMLSLVTPQEYENNFSAVLQRLKLTCRPEQRFIFFYGDKLHRRGLGRVFLAHCAIHHNDPIGYCDNYFYYSWEPQ